MRFLEATRYDRSWIMKLAHERYRLAQGVKPFGLCLKQAWETAKAIVDIAQMHRSPREPNELFPVRFALAFPLLAGAQAPKADRAHLT